jgi:hypothetical protein
LGFMECGMFIKRKGDTMAKTKEFKFRLTEKEFEEMRELAEQEGRTMSNLLRYLVAKERKEMEKK